MLREVSPFSWLHEYTKRIDSELSALFPSDSSMTLDSAARHALIAGGKRVRAILALLWCELFSDDYEKAVPVAVAYELAHASALVQDDIIDNSTKRRGEESIAAKYGLSTAILVSDLLLFNVPKMIARYEDLDSKKLAKLFDLVGESCRASTWGEFLDLEMTVSPSISEVEYEEMIIAKTSTLLAAPAASGAIVGGASDKDVEQAYSFGQWLGMAFQIQDDALDLFGDEKTLGKPIFNDLRNGKKSLVLIHCLNRCSEDEGKFLFSLLKRVGDYDQEEISKTRVILQKYGSGAYALSKSSYYLEQAKKILSQSRTNEAKTHLVELSDYLSQRYF
jgi:geranylgeranyl pyrophosphate synthase